MRIPSLLVALFMSLSAYAEVKTADPLDLANAPEGAIFEKLHFLFSTGTAPDFQPTGVLGFSGRCFNRTREDAVKGAGYLVTTDGTRNGPIGCGLKILSLWSDDVTLYDRMCVADVIRSGVSWNPATIVDGSLRAVLDASTGSFLRKNGDYYVEKLGSRDGTYASHYCYYYRPMPQ